MRLKSFHPCVSATRRLIDGGGRVIRLDSVPSWMRADFRQRREYFVLSARGKHRKLGAKRRPDRHARRATSRETSPSLRMRICSRQMRRHYPVKQSC
ncbi:hypothetical protein RB4176 [Rhodopirellula baltica SH 1]|uniref:Uncharacterized protein n=1 Tax=Rhodopirellula baltica (strain DSM 10527 / NCIMB 13988 / SH1) TaxID=243090 RepID=Q7UT16_RHOBA|nr:hypothetical protein RB4176 [Rhodopirellula baltica SH 1]